ncbi:hypothetical protein O9H85_08940 [Paenibacillus filicis]|uniref:Uncharacterized protein n=1 Tax=Paenibacillus gyeongsangnamensis TaxID=3388067 RepID=A0ABT4Q6N3_9BACL|nr:hypothetical protein [Paenibacillus filicis]MCZ8512538.1 hypothetical protein [Paenibacillus filicis]
MARRSRSVEVTIGSARDDSPQTDGHAHVEAIAEADEEERSSTKPAVSASTEDLPTLKPRRGRAPKAKPEPDYSELLDLEAGPWQREMSPAWQRFYAAVRQSVWDE